MTADDRNAGLARPVRVNGSSEQWDEERGIGLQELLAWMWAGRVWVIAGVVIFTLIAASIALFTTPRYRATTVLIPADSDRAGLQGALSSALGPLGGLASLAGVMDANSAATEESLAVLRSREFTESFIRDQNLMPELFADKWDQDANTWKVAEAKQPTLAQAFKRFDEKVRSVVQDKKTGLVRLRIDWTDRRKAASWANELVRRLNAEMRRRAISESDASLGFLQKELAATAVVDTRAAINRLIETQINRRMVANVSPEYAFRVVDRAMEADKSDMLWPRRGLVLLGGVLVGFFLGSAAAVVVGRTRQ